MWFPSFVLSHSSSFDVLSDTGAFLAGQLGGGGGVGVSHTASPSAPSFQVCNILAMRRVKSEHPWLPYSTAPRSVPLLIRISANMQIRNCVAPQPLLLSFALTVPACNSSVAMDWTMEIMVPMLNRHAFTLIPPGIRWVLTILRTADSDLLPVPALPVLAHVLVFVLNLALVPYFPWP